MGLRKPWVMVMLREKLQDKLAALPEHGMDYQVCDLTLKDGRILSQVMVSGCRAFHTSLQLKTDDVVDVKLSF